MSDESVSTLDQFAIPYGREVGMYNVEHESGLQLLRIRIREGNRFTILDIDQDTAVRWNKVMSAWVRDTNQQHGEDG